MKGMEGLGRDTGSSRGARAGGQPARWRMAEGESKHKGLLSPSGVCKLQPQHHTSICFRLFSRSVTPVDTRSRMMSALPMAGAASSAPAGPTQCGQPRVKPVAMVTTPRIRVNEGVPCQEHPPPAACRPHRCRKQASQAQPPPLSQCMQASKPASKHEAHRPQTAAPRAQSPSPQRTCARCSGSRSPPCSASGMEAGQCHEHHACGQSCRFRWPVTTLPNACSACSSERSACTMPLGGGREFHVAWRAACAAPLPPSLPPLPQPSAPCTPQRRLLAPGHRPQLLQAVDAGKPATAG